MALPYSESELLSRLLNGLAGRNASDPRPLNFLAKDSPLERIARAGHTESKLLLDEVRQVATTLNDAEDAIRGQTIALAILGKAILEPQVERTRTSKWEDPRIREIKEAARNEFLTGSYAEDFSAHV